MGGYQIEEAGDRRAAKCGALGDVDSYRQVLTGRRHLAERDVPGLPGDPWRRVVGNHSLPVLSVLVVLVFVLVLIEVK